MKIKTAGIVALVAGIAALLLSRIAAAAELTPTQQATQAADGGWSLVERYGPLWGGMLLAFGLGAAFLRRYKDAHWLSQGRRLAIATAAVSVVGACLDAKLGGGNWAGVLSTLGPALAMIMAPTITKAQG